MKTLKQLLIHQLTTETGTTTQKAIRAVKEWLEQKRQQAITDNPFGKTKKIIDYVFNEYLLDEFNSA